MTVSCPACGTFAFGQSIVLRVDLTVEGVLTDATTISLLLRRPDGTVLTATTIDHDATGKYHARFTLPETAEGVGQWFFRWESTGTAAGVSEGSFVMQASRVVVPV